MNFCPVCGNKTKNTFCEEHTQITFEYKEIVVRVCKCKKYLYRSRWIDFTKLKRVCEKIAKENIKAKVEANALIDETIEKKKFDIEVQYNGEQIIIPAKLIVEECPVCSKKDTPYFESTLQLRPKNQELLEFVKKQIEKDKNTFISKSITLKDGYNLLLSSNKAALTIGKKLNKSFKGELKTSRHIFGRDKQRSKDVYRVTVYFRKE
ncbi:MAG: 60S ribosomal export protein NMD3 [Nanoarchaeota archaeon]|nr:60S ribosomal export protein NMD3 [Nanoarchaeota archaeon]MBU1854746.1 60S ribosomal export protein NMD3 [Nanoarchaeota archaeon]